MYYIYKRTKTTTGFDYQLLEKISLFGCNIGFIPKLLQCYLVDGQNEPLFWHLNILEHYCLKKEPAQVPIINLKPNSATPNLSLFEIVNIYGHSHNGWTPILLHLRSLMEDENPNHHDVKDFKRTDDQIFDPIFTIFYLRGTVKGGKIFDKWTTPSASPTNSVLLWPETAEYFIAKMSELINVTKG